MVNAEHDNCYQHRHRFHDIEHPLVREWVPINPQGKFNEAINAADLKLSQPTYSTKSNGSPTYDNQSRRHINRQQYLTPSSRRISSPLRIRQLMEPPQYSHKEHECRQLRRQPHNQHIFSNLRIVSFPVPRRRNTRARHLDEKADDIAADKNSRQLACRESIDPG